MAKSLVLLERTPADADNLTYVDVADPSTADPGIASGGGDNSTLARYALRANGVAIKTYRTPLQVGIPSNSPILFDIGSYRPTLSVSGFVDVESSGDTMVHPEDGTIYYYPTLFQLQHAATQWNYLKGQEMTVTIIHTNVQSATYDKYNVAIQTCNFSISSLDQRRWSYDLAFVCTRPVAVRPSQNT
jgi:hypothetical protein